MKTLISLMLMLLLMASCVTLAACGGGDDDEEDGGATSEATAAPTSEDTEEPTSEDTEEPTSEATEEPTEEPTSDSTDDGDSGEFGDLDELDSYRMTVWSKTEMPGMGEVEVEIEMEIVNQPPPKASHMTMNDPMGMGMDIEYITIGDEGWMNMGGSWMPVPADEAAAQAPADISEYLDMDSNMDYIGTETVNGVDCKHYDVDAEFDIDVPDPMGGETLQADGSFVGEVWIADEGGLPEIMIRSVGTTEMSSQGFSMTSEDEVNILVPSCIIDYTYV